MMRVRSATVVAVPRITVAMLAGLIASAFWCAQAKALELRDEPLSIAEERTGPKEEPPAESVGEPSAEDAPVEGEPGAGEAPALPPEDAGDDAGSSAPVVPEDQPKQ